MLIFMLFGMERAALCFFAQQHVELEFIALTAVLFGYGSA